jgi:hypothetical protein
VSGFFGKDDIVKYELIASLLALSCALSAAQDSTRATIARPVNDISINLLGDASLFSLGYERLFICNPWLFLTEKTAVGYDQEFNASLLGSPPPLKNYLTITQHITGNFGKGICFFELGLGAAVIAGNTGHNFLYYPVVGFRLQPAKTKWRPNFRAFWCIPFYGAMKIYDYTRSDGTGPEPLSIPVGVSTGLCF